jgi:hypothetical protein
MKFLALIISLIFTQTVLSQRFVNKRKTDNKKGFFSGRVSKINRKASLVRMKIDFRNMRYLNKQDKVEFWEVHNNKLRCKGYIAGKSNDYLLIKVPDLTYCDEFVALNLGIYLHFYSQDLVNNLIMGEELVEILAKKHLAKKGQHSREKKKLDSHIEKVGVVNKRFQILRSKLEEEWRDEISDLEEDRLVTFKRFKDLEQELNDIQHKLEKYHISDENMVLDRWALDSNQYFRK